MVGGGCCLGLEEEDFDFFLDWLFLDFLRWLLLDESDEDELLLLLDDEESVEGDRRLFFLERRRSEDDLCLEDLCLRLLLRL